MAHLDARSLLLAIDGIDYTADVSRAVITSEPIPNTGGWLCGAAPWVDTSQRYHALSMTLAQDAASGALWALAWARHGEPADFHLAPYGNQFADAARPHYTGTVWITQPDGELLGGEASPSRRRVQTVQMLWPSETTSTQLTDGESYPAPLPAGW